MFSGVGMLDILTPLPDAAFPTFDMQKCPINIQAILMGPGLQVKQCKVHGPTLSCGPGEGAGLSPSTGKRSRGGGHGQQAREVPERVPGGTGAHVTGGLLVS